jgi:hypothetical protein
VGNLLEKMEKEETWVGNTPQHTLKFLLSFVDPLDTRNLRILNKGFHKLYEHDDVKESVRRKIKSCGTNDMVTKQFIGTFTSFDQLDNRIKEILCSGCPNYTNCGWKRTFTFERNIGILCGLEYPNKKCVIQVCHERSDQLHQRILDEREKSGLTKFDPVFIKELFQKIVTLDNPITIDFPEYSYRDEIDIKIIPEHISKYCGEFTLWNDLDLEIRDIVMDANEEYSPEGYKDWCQLHVEFYVLVENRLYKMEFFHECREAYETENSRHMRACDVTSSDTCELMDAEYPAYIRYCDEISMEYLEENYVQTRLITEN